MLLLLSVQGENVNVKLDPRYNPLHRVNTHDIVTCSRLGVLGKRSASNIDTAPVHLNIFNVRLLSWLVIKAAKPRSDVGSSIVLCIFFGLCNEHQGEAGMGRNKACRGGVAVNASPY